MTDATLPQLKSTSVPDDRALPLAVALAVFALVSLPLIIGGSRLLGDPDTHWHIAVGRWIVENRAMPYTDVFSHTHAGQTWIAKEWLSQLALYAAYQLGGWRGVSLLGVVCLGLSLSLAAYWLVNRVRWQLALIVLILMTMLATPSILSRPHLVALPLMLTWVLGVVRAADQNRAPPWWLVGVMLLWANAHAGYTIGFVIAGVLALEAVRNAGREAWLKVTMNWGCFLAAALLASALTPYGFDAILLTINLFGKAESLALIDEWQPMERDAIGLMFLGCGVLLIAGLAANPWRNLFRIILVAFLTYLMMRYVRFSLLFGFTAFFIALGPIGQRFAELRAQSLATRADAIRLAGIVVMSIMAAVALTRTPEPAARTMPVAAVHAARQAGLTDKPVYNSYNMGGYLISQRIPTYVDGRSDQLFLGGFLTAYETSRASFDHRDLLAHIAPFNVAWAIVSPDQPEAKRFAEAGWTQLFADDRSIVFTRPAH